MVFHGEPLPEPDPPFHSVGAFLRAFRRRHPDKTSIFDLDQGTSITWGELHDLVNRIARYLEGRGIGAGDRVVLLAEESLEKLACWMGIWRVGAVVCPINVEINALHLTEIITNIGPKLILWQAELDGPGLIGRIAAEKVMFGRWRSPDPAPPGSLFAELAGRAATPEVAHEYAPQDIAAIVCTSGTTARPKCVVLDHLSFWMNGLSTIDMLGLTAEDRTLEYRSFGWCSAQVLSLAPWMITGLTLHIARRFSHHRFFDWIRDHRITFAAGVPTVVNMLLNEPLGITAKDVPSLRLMSCSSAPLAPDQWTRFEEMYGVKLLQLYGMSEAGWICGNRHHHRKMGTVGPPVLYQELLIVDGEGKPCPPGVEGEITVGGPQLCVATISPEGEYRGNREARFHSGDLGMRDEDGFIRITGRIKDLIIRGGVNIAPLEIDNAVMDHPAVAEAAAVGISDRIYGEEIACYVVLRPGAAVSAADLGRHCESRLPAFKRPRMFYFIDALPKNDRGKVRRDDLKERWARDTAAIGAA